MDIEGFASLIEDEFSLLFNSTAVTIVYRREWERGYGMLSVGYDARGYRILFKAEQGGISMFVGPPGAPFDDEADWWQRGQWVNFITLSRFLTGHDMKWGILDKMSPEQRRKAVISAMSEAFLSASEQVSKMFASSEAMSQWKPRYDSYLRSRVDQELHRGSG